MKLWQTFTIFLLAAAFSGCTQPSNQSANATATSNTNTPNAQRQTITIAERPQRINEMMAARDEQEKASPVLKIIEPKADTTVRTSTVKVKLGLSGDLKGYTPRKDRGTQMGNHIHVILDNQPYEAYYDLSMEFELRNVSDGEHTLRVFPSRPWHESYKNNGAFQMVKFTVKNSDGAGPKPATTDSGNIMSNAGKAAGANANAVATPEGKDMQSSTAGQVDPERPLLTYSRPKGEYNGGDADAVMIDFWLSNGKLVGDGGEYRVRYTVDRGEPGFIDKWQPIWLSGWTDGKHTVTLELVDKAGSVVENGGYNSTTREITVAR